MCYRPFFSNIISCDKHIMCKICGRFSGTWKSKPGSLYASNESTSNWQSTALSTSGEESPEWPKNLLDDGRSRIEVDDNMHNMRLCFNNHFTTTGKNAQNYIWQCVMNNKLASRYSTAHKIFWMLTTFRTCSTSNTFSCNTKLFQALTHLLFFLSWMLLPSCGKLPGEYSKEEWGWKGCAQYPACVSVF